MTQRLEWEEEYFEVTPLKLLPSSLTLGDFVVYKGDARKIITIQKNVPRFSNLRYTYTHFTLQGRDGRIFSADDVAGRQQVFRPKKLWKKVPA